MEVLVKIYTHITCSSSLNHLKSFCGIIFSIIGKNTYSLNILKIKAMKKLLLIFAGASIFAACNNNPKNGLETTKQVVADTGRIYNNNLYTDTAASVPAVAPGGTLKSTRQTTVRDNTGVHTVTTTTTTSNTPNGASNRSTRHTAHHRASSSGNGTLASNSGTSNSGTGTTQPVRKKGWSKAAKGAVIGGVGGAVAGAIIDKKHGQGAVIGGVVGAAGGYIIGRGKDKKDGR